MQIEVLRDGGQAGAAPENTHDPPASVNDRARDVVDLLLLRDLIDATQHPTLGEVRATETRTVAAAPIEHLEPT